MKKRNRNGKYIDCCVCKKEIYVYPKKIGRTKYCSLECRDKDWENNSPIGKEKHWNWKGGKTKIKEYVYLKVKNHPNRNSGNYVAEHRLVMEKKLNRYLTFNEEVHHKNGIKDDNRIENLEIVIKKKHFGEVKCPHCLKKFKIK